MDAQQVLSTGQQGLTLLLMVAAPVLLVVLVVGLVVSIFQAATQINEATLSFVPGAESPEVMALAENGGVIVFMRSFTEVLRVPATGGTPTLVAALPTSARVTGISCQGSECVITQLGGTVGGGGEGTRIYRIRLATNAVDLLTTVAGRWAGPVLLPTGGDVVMQASTTPTRDLYLFKGLLP